MIEPTAAASDLASTQGSEPPAPGSAGLIVRLREAGPRGPSAATWIPATVAQRVALASATTLLGVSGGVALGLALSEGRLLTLIAFGRVAPRAPIVICARPDGDVFALAVAAIVASGRFDDVGEDGAVSAFGETAAAIDLPAILGSLEAAFWIAEPASDRLSLVPWKP